MFATVKEALRFLSEQQVEMVDLKVAGVNGRWLHVSIPARRFGEQDFAEGVGYDGSSGAGYASVENGDVAALPDPTTGFIDPFLQPKTLSFICTTVRADTKEPLRFDPRATALRAVEHMRSTRLADEVLMAPEYEFYIFERARSVNEALRTIVQLEPVEAIEDGALRRAYMLTPPADRLQQIRAEIATTLEQIGVAVRYHHHEVGEYGQCEIEVGMTSLVRAADQAMLVKYVAKNIAAKHGKIATFMPKPIYGHAGNGMHVHQKLELAGQPIFYDSNDKAYAHLSGLALSYVGGLLAHGRALAALTNPSTNSYKRLVPGYEAPVSLFFSLANRSAAIRVPRYAVSPVDKRIEYRPPDATCNVYFALAGMLMAGLDGIENRIDVQSHHFGPFDVDFAHQPAEFRAKVAALPTSLTDAMNALARDSVFLTKGGVFASEQLANWAESKIQHEAQEIDQRPHPYEFALYLDV